MSWLKAKAPENMEFMLVTPEVSYAPMSSLKEYVLWNKYAMSVTPPVSHVEMWPYVVSAAVASASHAVTAVRMVVSSKGGAAVGSADPRETLGLAVGAEEVGAPAPVVGLYDGAGFVAPAPVVGLYDGAGFVAR